MYIQKQLIPPTPKTQHVLIIWPLYNIVSQSGVTELVPQQVQGYGCSYSVYTSLSLMSHHVWGQCKLLDIQICCHTFLSILSTLDLRTSVYEGAIFLYRVWIQDPLAVVRFHRLLWGCTLWRQRRSRSCGAVWSSSRMQADTSRLSAPALNAKH